MRRPSNVSLDINNCLAHPANDLPIFSLPVFGGCFIRMWISLRPYINPTQCSLAPDVPMHGSVKHRTTGPTVLKASESIASFILKEPNTRVRTLAISHY